MKIYEEGSGLKKQKQEVMNRRIFVRVFSEDPIKLDIESIFSKFGKIETAYLVSSSQTFEDGKYTMIGYVLYFDQEIAN